MYKCVMHGETIITHNNTTSTPLQKSLWNGLLQGKLHVNASYISSSYSLYMHGVLATLPKKYQAQASAPLSFHKVY